MGYKKLSPLQLPESPASLGYLAGLLDGEGHISIVRAFDKKNSKSFSHSLRVVITNTDQLLLGWLIGAVKGGNVSKKTNKNQPTWKPSYNWCLYGKNAEDFLGALLPYLVIKKTRAELALKFRRLPKGKWKGRQLDPEVVRTREELLQDIHKLNERGVLVLD